LLFTDGLLEAVNSEGQTFGQKRVADVLRQTRQQQPQQIIDNMFLEVERFTGEVMFQGDISMVVVTVPE